MFDAWNNEKNNTFFPKWWWNMVIYPRVSNINTSPNSTNPRIPLLSSIYEAPHHPKNGSIPTQQQWLQWVGVFFGIPVFSLTISNILLILVLPPWHPWNSPWHPWNSPWHPWNSPWHPWNCLLKDEIIHPVSHCHQSSRSSSTLSPSTPGPSANLFHPGTWFNATAQEKQLAQLAILYPQQIPISSLSEDSLGVYVTFLELSSQEGLMSTANHQKNRWISGLSSF